MNLFEPRCSGASQIAIEVEELLVFLFYHYFQHVLIHE